MKQQFLILSFSILAAVNGLSQSDAYITGGGEMIFSFANIEDQGESASSLMRWAPFFNLQCFYNSDLSDKSGIFAGLAIRNVGYIYEDYKSESTQGVEYKKKFRSYNLGIPLGIKFGNLEEMFFYGGYEIEFPFHYKEKTYDNGDKIDKITGWFSKRQEPFQHGFFAGIQFPQGLNFKFKYYLSEFHNQGYTDGAGLKPYEELESKIFYFSLSYYIFHRWGF